MSTELSAVLNTFVGAVLGFAAAVFAEPLMRRLYRPKLELEFGNDPGCRVRTPEQVEQDSTHEADYIRIKVRNVKPAIAKNCSAYLVRVEKADDSGEFESTIYGDSIPLSWSCRGAQAYVPLNLPRGVVQFVDVVSTRSISTYFKPEIKPYPFSYDILFKQTGRFRFTVQVSGENVKPVFIKIIFVWSGEWDKYEASLG